MSRESQGHVQLVMLVHACVCTHAITHSFLDLQSLYFLPVREITAGLVVVLSALQMRQWQQKGHGMKWHQKSIYEHLEDWVMLPNPAVSEDVEKKYSD